MQNEQITAILEERLKIKNDEAQEIVGWIRGVNQLEEDMSNHLFMWYCLNSGMPYAVAKARAGDPMEWIFQTLTKEFNDS